MVFELLPSEFTLTELQRTVEAISGRHLHRRNFRRLVEAVQRKGVRVTVVSTIRSSPPMVADELRRQADVFIDLSDLSENIARNHTSGRQSTAEVESSNGGRS